jgi:hypothetical protein
MVLVLLLVVVAVAVVFVAMPLLVSPALPAVSRTCATWTTPPKRRRPLTR